MRGGVKVRGKKKGDFRQEKQSWHGKEGENFFYVHASSEGTAFVGISHNDTRKSLM